jgi:hypothetical protein
MRPPILIITLTLALTACTQEQDMGPPPANPPMENACGATDLQNLVGQDAAVLETMRFGQTVRILRPGMAVTMDFSAERLNIGINESEKIEAVTCG